jgi:GntR family transcriptional regulator, transcriptional repressor for pyruvate dehydrogenase complex
MQKSAHGRGTAWQSLTGDVKSTLLDWIREGRYPAESQLPSVPQLVEQLGVSRTVVREALQALVGMDLIEMRPGMGSFVKSVPPEMIMNADVMAALIDTDTMMHVVHARIVLESSVAALAATEATESDFQAIEEILETFGPDGRSDQSVFAMTPLFHVAVARATHNPILESVIASFNALMSKTGELLEKDAGKGYRKKEYVSHRDLLKVLRQRNPEAARKAMADHVQLTLVSLQRLLKKKATETRAAAKTA